MVQLRYKYAIQLDFSYKFLVTDSNLDVVEKKTEGMCTYTV